MNISEINKESVEQRIKIILIFSIFIAMLGFLTDFENTLKYRGADLRTRVVGARFLINRFDPYSSKWNDDLSDFYLDPGDHKYSPVNKVLDTPTILFIHSLFAKIPYKLQRIIWFAFQWIFLVLTLFLLASSTGSKNRSKLIWIIGFFFISGSSFWRLHVEKGQIYILYIFLITFAYWLSQRISKNSQLFSGILLGLTASLYPPIIVIYIPMLIFKRWKLFGGNICGLLLGLIISIVKADLSLWKKYISSMYIHIKMNLGLIDYYGLYSKFDPEGMNNFFFSSVMPPFDSSLPAVIKIFFGINLSLNTSIVFLSIFIILCIFLLYKCL